jgi:hypothetical protein
MPDFALYKWLIFESKCMDVNVVCDLVIMPVNSFATVPDGSKAIFTCDGIMPLTARRDRSRPSRPRHKLNSIALPIPSFG